MEFHIEKHSSTPVAKQIEEQIKLGVMMGVFRDGDTLPSIRDIEKQTGINRSQIHKAYLDLRKSGLLVPTRGKGSVITTATDYPQSVNENCYKLSETIISRVKRMGVSPTAFARYLSRHAQDSERNEPFIIYIDIHEEIAVAQAAEISKLWRVPVSGMGFNALKSLKEQDAVQYKILVNHVMCEHARSLLPGKESLFIPIEVHYPPETIRKLAKIKPDSSVKLLLLPHPSHRVRFMMTQTQKLIKSHGVKITPVTIRSTKSMTKQLQNKDYDYCIVGPALRGGVPAEMRKNPDIILMDPQLDPVSLEIARIRAGVII